MTDTLNMELNYFIFVERVLYKYQTFNVDPTQSSEYYSGAALEIFDWGVQGRGLGDGSPLVRSRCKAPVGGLGTVPQKLKHF